MVPRSCSSRCRTPSSHSWAVLRCEASTREDSSLRLLENLSICSMMPFRDLGVDRVTRPGGLSTAPLGWAGRRPGPYRVWEVALVTASISRSFSSFSRCSCSSWSLRISRMEALRGAGTVAQGAACLGVARAPGASPAAGPPRFPWLPRHPLSGGDSASQQRTRHTGKDRCARGPPCLGLSSVRRPALPSWANPLAHLYLVLL